METTCDRCGRGFLASRTDARYCSGKCRTEAYRVRRRGERPKRAPLPEQVRRRTYDLGRAVRSLDALANDDRVRRWGKTDAAHRAALELYGLAETIRDAAWRLSGSKTDAELLAEVEAGAAKVRADLAARGISVTTRES